MLHKLSELLRYHIVATDGEIGHVDDFLMDEGGQTVRYLVVDTSNWIGGRSVLISATAVEQIDSPARKIYVNLLRDAIKAAPR
jgi:sporulation protein YlmC with PRC-barrel domain